MIVMHLFIFWFVFRFQILGMVFTFFLPINSQKICRGESFAH